ncbi:hypothetical protein MJO10_33215, partial [Salmonella enterica subsp. enterica serovar Anatum]|nr:hypothetical protein [Salmonella enterica subsp. enterica serovar Anatum]
PFVKQHNDKLTITLWLSGENPPSRVTLRSEFDNEEISLAMRNDFACVVRECHAAFRSVILRIHERKGIVYHEQDSLNTLMANL